MQPGTDAEIRALPYGTAVRAALAMHTCPVSFWAAVARQDSEGDVFPVVAFGPLYRLAAVAALIVAFGLACWWKGAEHAERKAEALRARELAGMFRHAQELARRADEITLVYLTQTRTVRERGNTIVREVPRYVTADDDRACPVPAGFIGVLNAAARNELPGATGRADAAAAGPASDP
jgi:hypothetical protein